MGCRSHHTRAWPLCSVLCALLQACVGFFYGAMPTLRSRCIPDDLQSSVMNILRVPLVSLFTLT